MSDIERTLMIDHGHLEGAVWYCDELQINKSLFGSEVGHVESLNMGLGGLPAVQLYCIHFIPYYKGWSLPYAPYINS